MLRITERASTDRDLAHALAIVSNSISDRLTHRTADLAYGALDELRNSLLHIDDLEPLLAPLNGIAHIDRYSEIADEYAQSQLAKDPASLRYHKAIGDALHNLRKLVADGRADDCQQHISAAELLLVRHTGALVERLAAATENANAIMGNLRSVS